MLITLFVVCVLEFWVITYFALLYLHEKKRHTTTIEVLCEFHTNEIMRIREAVKKENPDIDAADAMAMTYFIDRKNLKITN